MTDAVEAAARRLAVWRGTSAAWFAEVEWHKPAEPGESAEHEPSALACAFRGRGRIESRDATSAELEAWEQESGHRLRRSRTWKQTQGVVIVPRRSCQSPDAAALSFARLPGPLGPLLLLYACEDWSQWGTVERFAMACYPHPEAICDAMARILWRRAPIAQDARAKTLGMRASTYRKRTATAERMLWRWLDRAACGFLLALWSDGTDLHPASDINSRTLPPGNASRAAPRHGRQLSLDRAA